VAYLFNFLETGALNQIDVSIQVLLRDLPRHARRHYPGITGSINRDGYTAEW
jgi:hypothetical protein